MVGVRLKILSTELMALPSLVVVKLDMHVVRTKFECALVWSGRSLLWSLVCCVRGCTIRSLEDCVEGVYRTVVLMMLHHMEYLGPVGALESCRAASIDHSAHRN